MAKTIDYDTKRKRINLYSINDIHVGSKSCKLDKFKELVKVIKDDKNGFVVLNGDYIDAIRPGDPRFDIHEVDAITNDVYKQYALFKQIITPIKDKIICVGNGNHEYTVKKFYGFDISFMLAEEFKVPVFEDVGMLRLKVGKKVYRIMVVHGSANSVNPASNFSKMFSYGKDFFEKTPDIVLGAHMHRLAIVPDTKLTDEFSAVTTYRALCGSFYGGYEQDLSNYASHKLYPPLPIGYVFFGLDEGGVVDGRIVVM